MSVIAYRHPIMAADTRAFLDRYSASPGIKAKIRRLDDGTLIGVTSPTPGTGERVMDWYAAGADPDWNRSSDAPEDFKMLVVLPNGNAMIYQDNLHPTGPLMADYYAIGSGCDFALGALACDKSAAEAVEIACRFDPFCALPILMLTHGAPQ